MGKKTFGIETIIIEEKKIHSLVWFNSRLYQSQESAHLKTMIWNLKLEDQNFKNNLIVKKGKGNYGTNINIMWVAPKEESGRKLKDIAIQCHDASLILLPPPP